MNILLINNSTKHLGSLRKSLVGHNLTVVKYSPGINQDTSAFDLVILSGGGGEGREANDNHKKSGNLWYSDEMELIKNCKVPLIGICMGFEVICKAYGAQVDKVGRLVSGFKVAETTQKGKRITGQDAIRQFESHSWRVRQAPRNFEVLASSGTGIEMIRHRTKAMIATQFHPEVVGGTLSLAQLVDTLMPAKIA